MLPKLGKLWQKIAKCGNLCHNWLMAVGNRTAADNGELARHGRAWAVWVVGVLAYIVTVMQRTSLGDAGLEAANLDSREAWRGLFRIDGPAAPVRVSAGR